jgi:hypothetical protein
MKHYYFEKQYTGLSAFNKKVLNYLLVSFVVLFCTAVQGQGTSCTNATALTINGACATNQTISDNGENAPNANASSCFGTGNNFRREGWYSFTVASGPINVTITAISTNRNLLLQLVSGSCAGTLTETQCANANNASDSAQTESITASLAAGTYYIKVSNINGAGGNNMNLSSICVTAPVCTTPSAQPSALVLSAVTNSSINGSFTAASPAPSGYLVLRSTSATAPSPGPVNGTAYTVGNTISGATVVAASNATTFSTTALTSNTKYYFYIYAYNSNCIGTPFYQTTAPLTNNATTCPAPPTAPLNSGITGTGGTISWTASIAGGAAAAISYTLEVYTDAGYTVPISGSPFAAGTAVTYTLSGLNPSTTYYYRIKANNGSCDSSYVTNTLQTNCTTPSVQPTTLVFNTLTSTSIAGSFTAASPAPSGYLIVRSTSATPPTPVNGTTYAVGSNLGAGTYVVQGSAVTSAAVSFTDTGLTSNTQYYYYIYSYNNSCNGAPYYLTTAPLSNNAITCPAAPTAAVNSAITGSAFTVSWTASIAGGSASSITYTLEVYTNAGYTIPISGSPFSMGTAVTATLTGLNAATTYYYRIKANNGSCDSAYLTGSVLTGCTTPSAQPTTLVLSTITSTSISGAFTAASPAPSGYLIVRSTSAIAPTLANGTTYAVGFTGLTPGITRVIQGSAVTSTAVTFTDTGLTSNTKYYYHIFSYNNGCGGAPYYLTTTPLTNNAITCPAAPTAAVNSAITGSGFTVSWTASPVGGGAATINYTLEVYTNATYTTPISGSPFSVGTALTYTLSGLTGPTTYYYRIKATNGSCDSSYLTNSATTLLSNDNCTGAIAITPSTSCTYTTYTNAGATASAGVPAPGCANYLGGDVWFSVVVPSTGAITINSIEGVITDGGMAVYTGTCAGLTLLQCDDDSSINGLMPYMVLTGLTPNSTLWIRFWEYGNDNNGTFGLCVTAPIPCAAGPGTGTTTVPCPSVTSGGLGLNGAPPQALTCGATAACVDLEATFPLYYNTTTYTVASIPYAPPYQYTCLANAVSVNVDDVWSPLISLPFNFCFYGNNYNQCLIGSNGTISFDTTNNVAGGTSTWSFANNLPNNTLFLNTIFGVYHDIDPSKGGKVGWELITLNTGCRALVASWSDIPMFSATCNAQLYTGMIVLYENTNVIEVYIKDKSVCSSWNGGNAIVGLQNATGTQAVVAPGRNALDADWAVTNEAWRFTPAGASITSIKWYQGAGTTGPVVGTTATVNVCPTATTTYTAEVSYALCNGTTLKTTGQTTVTISSGKTWNGSIDIDWNKANNWSPSGVPTSADCVVIPNVTNDPHIFGSGYNAVASTLTIESGGDLELENGNNITVTDFIKVLGGGSFTVRNGANVVQINNNAVNTGTITMERTTNVHNYDYVYWSSPVAGFSSAAISPGTSSYLIYKWDPTASNGNGGQGTWVGGSETMTAGKGYIVRGPDAYGTLAPFTASFTGVPNNGIIQPTIARGSITGPNFTGTNGANITNLDDNWNLLGNPYPSAINATTFLANNPNIDGNIRIWTHGSPISDTNPNPFYGSFLQNYTVNDYVSYNATGSTPPGYNGKIGAGQGFFVVMNDGAAATSTVTFNNSLRSSAYNNTQFYKSNANEASTADEAHRIWLSLVDSSSSSATTLLGYVTDATYDKDRLFDAPYKVVPQLSIYSLLDSNPMIIQGRPVPFDDNDFIPLGVTIPAGGVYTIAINQVDGLFGNAAQTIYLEDLYNNVVYDLRQAPYSFSANAGNYADRFILRYKTTPLSNTAFDSSATYGYISNQTLHIKSTEQIKEIALFDIAGKHIITYKTDVNKTNIEEHFPYANGVYIATIKLENGKIVTQKLLN